jgi:hypothetical protein
LYFRPDFDGDDRITRQMILLTRFNFLCTCKACENDYQRASVSSFISIVWRIFYLLTFLETQANRQKIQTSWRNHKVSWSRKAWTLPKLSLHREKLHKVSQLWNSSIVGEKLLLAKCSWKNGTLLVLNEVQWKSQSLSLWVKESYL